MTTPHKPCPWCGTCECLEVYGGRIVCDECGCQGPLPRCILRETVADRTKRAWARWDEARGNVWEDYEETEA
jgi:hypothetical protein